MNLRRDVFQAIADPTRRAILLLVASQSLTAGAIAANFDTARPTVSKHLQILTECELLKQEQNGREIYYHLNPKKMKEIAEFIEPFRNMWEQRFNKLETIMKKYKQADCFISILLIAGFTVMSFVNRDDTFITGYFVTVIFFFDVSAIPHKYFNNFT